MAALRRYLPLIRSRLPSGRTAGRIAFALAIGAEGNFSTLRGQHNPDYIPASRGGPAILVADSHNDRAVEYQWKDGEWVRTWQWSDALTQWTRDADRLPGGETLITDTNGDRILEVNESGGVVWSVAIEKPYEAERLGTGDESATGKSAAALGLRSRTGGHTAATETLYGSTSARVWHAITGVVPPFALNSVLFIVPKWMGPTELVPLVVISLIVMFWSGCEAYWRAPGVVRRLRTEQAEPERSRQKSD